MTAFPGPVEFGRGVVIDRGQPAPPGFVDAPSVVVSEDTLLHPGAALHTLHRCYASRQPALIQLQIDHRQLLVQETESGWPWELSADFEFPIHRLHFLVWANNYDLRSGEPVWWLTRKAVRLGAGPGAATDIVLPDGRAAWIDGGPRGPIASDEPVVHRESIELGRLHTSPTHPALVSGDLADDQLAATRHPAGPARIIAPAGSGKTRTLVARLEHLLRDRWTERELVTAVAYNARAQSEMTQRLGSVDANVRTIHSLAYAVVRSARPGVTVIDEADQRRILAPLIPKTPAANKDITAPYLEALRDVRIGLQRPEVVAEARDDVPGFAELFWQYREALQHRNAIDFDDQISEAIRLLLTDPARRTHIQRSARHLLVDEFQDLTPAFLLLLRLVSAPSYNVFAVGDDDQVIYGYAGATPDYLIGFERLFPGAVEYALDSNYRCPAPVTDAALKLLSYNRRRIPKTIVSRSGRPEGLELRTVPIDQAASTAADAIEEWLADRSGSEVAVLSRVNHALVPIQAVLTARRIPHNAPVGEEFLRRSAVNAVLAYLRIGLAPQMISADDLHAVVNRPARRLATTLRSLTRRQRRWTIERLRTAADQLGDSHGERLHLFVDDLESVVNAVRTETTADAIAVIRHAVGLDQAARMLDSSRSTADRSGHGDDLDALEQVAQLFPEPQRFEIELRDVLARPGATDHDAMVNLSTIHRVKGMEWPMVVVLGLNARLMPHYRAADLEEERRVFHVALTRAVEKSVLIGDEKEPSRFIDELRGAAPVVALDPTPTGSSPNHAGGVLARLGTQIGWDGQAGEAVGFEHDGLRVVLSTGIKTIVPYGTIVDAGGVQGRLAKPPATDAAPDPSVFEALRAWRKERANQDSVPAFLILSDKHLRGIAAARPATPESLLACPGIGPTKLDQYGDDILDVIEASSA